MPSASDLTAASWQSFSRLLDEALELPAGERLAWLDDLGAEHESLKPALRALLLRSNGVETAWLATLPRSEAAPPALEESDLKSGGLVGPYRLIRELGTGGMGAVWLAERADGSLKRQIALKLPRASWARGLAERLARERDILAALEHPNIARLYDAGTDAQGRPYLALEYVEGQPIDVYCRERSLNTKARLALLLQVAQAVAFAHSRLVIHRDLKPSNILVTADGSVRLLDFGIAKLMEGDRTQETQLTQLAGRALTLDYASPEQIRGEPIGTASDVYSLGVVAYELLAGAKPYKLKRPTAAQLEDAIASIDAPLASATATEAAAKKALKGDLDAILNKALKKNVGERYVTVDAFAQDLRNHLDNRPVQARPDTLAYRLLRVVQRHRWPVLSAVAAGLALWLAIGFGATAIVTAALASGLAAAVFLARRAARERDRALALAERNAAGNLFLDMLITRAARGGPVTAMELLERCERLIEREVRENAEHRAFVLGLIADLYLQIEQPARAVALFARAIESASRTADSDLKDSLASRRALAIARLGRVDEGIATMEAILARHDVSAENRCRVHLNRAAVASNNGDFADALRHAEEALRWFRSAPQMPRRTEAILLGELAWACLKNGQSEEAERYFDASIAAFERLGLADSAPALQHGAHRALMYQELGDLARAIALYEQLMAESLRATPDAPPALSIVANHAYALAHAGRFSEAEAGYRRSAELALQQRHPLIRYNIRMLIVELLAMQQRTIEAKQELEAAESERDFDAPEGGPAVFARQQAEARLALAENRPEVAVQVFTDALQSRHVAAGTANALLGRAAALEKAGDLQQAECDARDALQIAQKLQGTRLSSFRTGLAWLALSRIHQRRGQLDKARRCADSALAQLRPQLDPRHPGLIEALRLASDTSRVASS